MDEKRAQLSFWTRELEQIDPKELVAAAANGNRLAGGLVVVFQAHLEAQAALRDLSQAPPEHVPYKAREMNTALDDVAKALINLSEKSAA